MSSDSLNECLFCISKPEPQLQNVGYGAAGFVIWCQNCGAQGPECKTKEEAIERWNNAQASAFKSSEILGNKWQVADNAKWLDDYLGIHDFPWDFPGVLKMLDIHTEQMAMHLPKQDKRDNFICAAKHSDTGANDPQDCDWPTCGCDEYADKVVAVLQEQYNFVPHIQPAREMVNVKDASRYRYLKEQHSFRYGATNDSPMECGISYNFQQTVPKEAAMDIDDAIDNDIDRLINESTDEKTP